MKWFVEGFIHRGQDLFQSLQGWEVHAQREGEVNLPVTLFAGHNIREKFIKEAAEYMRVMDDCSGPNTTPEQYQARAETLAKNILGSAITRRVI